jgi:hypothetical protein
MDTVASF